jgi:hypothetical protein
MLSTHLRLGLPSGLFTSGFLTNYLYAISFSPITGMKCLRPLEHWNSGFESYSRHGCLFILFVLGSAISTGWSPVQGVLPTILD